ncbi:unnamed protein product [Brassicogethes aeneus]|uniref:2-aminoethanethiol dioxygenase n=1 Tax=Brassicogethes aeneus TaxID=1431903 RepID=A0A9P0FGM0_BRAAE|nr:unnamed protein product [Brassicogethes aeneus]
MLSHIGSVLRQARVTFTCSKDLLYQNIEILKALLDKTTSEDVNLSSQFQSEELWKRPNKAPVSYIDIFEDDNFTVGIFVLRPGMKLPLHDHPEMFGLIKVISGKIKVRSFSMVQNETGGSKGFFKKTFFKDSVLKSNVVVVEKCDDIILDKNSESCILEPDIKNLHEIESVDGPAAFIDILSPPYDTEIPLVGPRKCNYYSTLSQVSQNVFKLQKVGCPSWYWTDSFQYTGPDLPTEIKAQVNK